MKYIPPRQQINILAPHLSSSLTPPILKSTTYDAAEQYYTDVPIDTVICIHATFHSHITFHYTTTRKMNGWTRQVHVIHPKDPVGHNCPFSNRASSSKS
jgi:hypothetical protein